MRKVTIALLVCAMLLVPGLLASTQFAAAGQPLAPAGAGIAISDVTVAVQGTTATITWTTNRAASSTVIYGTTADYEAEPALADGLVTDHAVTLTGLQPGTTYHFRAVSSDNDGVTAHSNDQTFVTPGRPPAAPRPAAPEPQAQATSATAAGGPVFDVWYGPNQSFGQRGNPQRWINILGNVKSQNGFQFPQFITDTTAVWPVVYSLNGGPPQRLGVGTKYGHPNKRRLYRTGDFNVEIDHASLQPGANTVVISATDKLTVTAATTVTVNYTPGQTWPLPYSVDWSQVTNIQDVAQVVDGRWTLTNGQVCLSEADAGYDRILALGDEIAWKDYEVTVPITIQKFTGTTAGVGVVLRWKGHVKWDDSQPTWGYYPLGAIGWYSYDDGINPVTGQPYGMHLNIYWGNAPLKHDTSGRKLGENTTYIFKMRVESQPDGRSLYFFKVWPAGTPEPPAWDLTTRGKAEELKEGSLLLLAHLTAACFGNVTVTPVDPSTFTPTPTGTPAPTSTPFPTLVPPTLTPTPAPAPASIRSDDFSGSVLGSQWQFINPSGNPPDGRLEFNGKQALISVPEGVDHSVWVGGNKAPRLMQTVNNTNFEVEVKFESVPSGSNASQGIVVEADPQNFLRFDFSSDSKGPFVYAAAIGGGKAKEFFDTRDIGITIANVGVLYMRVKRVGDTWTQSFSYDGQQWAAAPPFDYPLSVSAVGVFAGNAGNRPPAYTGVIDYFFNTAAPIAVEDPSRAYLPVLVKVP